MHASKLLALSCAAAMSSVGTFAQAADVVIGVPGWPSVRATAHVLKVALEEKLGLEVELQNGSNAVLFEAMDAGSIQVHPEVWLPNNEHLKRQYVDAKKSVKLSPNSAAGEQAMCVSRATAERTGITELKQLADPDMAGKFDSDGDGKGEIWIGAAGWASTTIEQIRARSYGYVKTMSLDEMDESLALANVEDAIKNDRNIVFYCYSPHHMFKQYDLVILEEPEYDATKWMIVQPSPTPGWLEKSRAGVAYKTNQLFIAYSASLEADHPEAAAMLSKVSLDTDTVSAMTYALVVEEQDPAEFAAAWVEENTATIDGWLE